MIPLLEALGTIGLALALPKLPKLFKELMAKWKQQAEERRQREEAERQRKEAAEKRKAKMVRQQGGLIAKELEQLSKQFRLSSEKLEVLYLAAIQQAIHFNLGIEQTAQIVSYPTNRMSYAQISDVSQLPQVSLAESVLEDDLFYHKFVNQDLMRPEYYDVTEIFKRLYVLWDVSRSMWGTEFAIRLPDGEIGLRETWARAILASLLRDAAEGQAEYFIRPFSGETHDLYSALSRPDALKILSWIIEGGVRGDDTNIGRAIMTAVNDIRERQNTDARMNHILLITDGDDNAGLTREKLVEILGSDIKLHVALIATKYGTDHPLAPYVIATH